MSNQEIVEEVARKFLVEECILTVTGGVWRFEYSDLKQDILVELLEMNSKKLQKLYNKNQLKYFLLRIVKNNIQSNTSRFWYRYRRYSFLNQGPESKAYLEKIDPDTEDE